MIHIYTGDGKGKSTAALGLALRACGQGWRVLIIQFLKCGNHSGELKISRSIPGLELICFGVPNWVHSETPSEEDLFKARMAFEKANEAVSGGRYDLVVLDEVNVALDFGLIPIEDAVQLLKKKPDSVELVLTGRNAHPKLIELADYVSEIHEMKHPYRKKISGREGIEY